MDSYTSVAPKRSEILFQKRYPKIGYPSPPTAFSKRVDAVAMMIAQQIKQPVIMGEIPVSFQLNNPPQPQTLMLTILQLSHSDIMTMIPYQSTHPTHNSTEKLLKLNNIRVALPVSHNRKLSCGLFALSTGQVASGHG